jgi:hypothetical protein
MIDMINIKIWNSLASKLEDLLHKFMSDGYKFFESMEKHFNDVHGDTQQSSFEVLLTVVRYNGKYFYTPQTHILRRGSALIAKLAKKDPKLADQLKGAFKLECNIATIGEEQLAQLIMNLDFKSVPEEF